MMWFEGMRGEVEDIAELMQHIQSRLPVKEAARTSVLSKSWLRAWSTIPTLRFEVGRGKSMRLVDVDRTLIRYHRDNIPIERFDLKIAFEDQESASHAEKWIGPIATKTCLKEFSLTIVRHYASFTFPDEILSGQNLTKLRVSAKERKPYSVQMATSLHPVINCVSLRELQLEGVCVSQEVLHDILSSCSLLVKLALLRCCKGFKTLKVKNLPRLYELQILLDASDATALEISDVPNLGVFSYALDLLFWTHVHQPRLPFNACSISLGSSVTQLMLGDVLPDNACLEMFKSQFPFLERLTLHLNSWSSGSFHLTCASIKRLSLKLCPLLVMDVQVYAPKLIYFEFGGDTLPSLLFPVSSLMQIKFLLSLQCPVDAKFFLKMREALALSRKCYLHISTELPLDIDMDDLRKGLLFPPARNVQQLCFETRDDECLWERSPFFDAFFEICHPKHVFAKSDVFFSHSNHFCRLMLREVLEKNTTRTAYWHHYLKHVQIRDDPHKKWSTLKNSHRRFLDGSAPDVYLDFKLMWR